MQLTVCTKEISPKIEVSLFVNKDVLRGFPKACLGGSDRKESSCTAGDPGSIPRLGRSPGGGRGNPLQYSCLENPSGQRSLVGYSPWGCREFNTTEGLRTAGGAFLLAQWYRICLPMQGTGFWSLIRKEPTCYRVTNSVQGPQLLSLYSRAQELEVLRPRATLLKPGHPRACALPQEKPPQWKPAHRN